MNRLGRMVRRSLIARLVFSFLGVSVAMVIAGAVIAYYQAQSALRGEVVSRLGAIADSKQKQLERWVEAQRIEVEYIARLAQRHFDAPAVLPQSMKPLAGNPSVILNALLKRTTMRTPDFRELFILTVPGARVLASTDTTRVGLYRVTDDYFLEGRAHTYIQRVYPSAAPPEGTPTLTISTPVRDSLGRTVAVLAAHLDLRRIDSITADRSGLGVSGEAYFTDRYRVFVSSTRFGRPEYPRGVQTFGVTEAASHRKSGDAAYDDYRGTPVLGVYRWIETQDLALVVEMDRSEAFAPARRLLGVIVLTGIISTLVLAAVTCLIALRIARPVKAIALTAERVARGDFSATAPVLTRDEIGRLARAFNRMTARLRRLYEGQQHQVEALGRAAAALEQSKALLQAIIDNTSAFILVADLQGRIVLANRTFAELIGESPEGVLGRTSLDVVPSLTPERRETYIAEALKSGRPVVSEETFTLFGETRTVLLARFQLRDAAGEPFAVCAVANEITEMKRGEEERRQFAAQLQHSQKLESLGVLAGGIAHDFNNLLTAILGHASLLDTAVDSGTAAAVDVQRIIEAARRAADMTNQMLAYAGRAKFAVEMVDLNALITQMCQLLQVSIPKKIEVRYELASGLPAVEGDPVQLQQVVMNLITNAAEAIGDQPGIVTLRTDLVLWAPGTVPDGDCVRLEVSDTGAGMDAATQARIFEPFFTTKFTGRGLGLAAVQGIVHGHRGTLTVTSAPGRGTTFSALLPATAAPAPVVPAPPKPQSQRGNGTIMIVDDEEVIRRVSKRALEHVGYHVIVAEDGARAVDIFRAEGSGIDLVVLDLTMPVMDGPQTLHALRLLDPSVRVLLSSGFTEHDLSARGETVDEPFLQKPYRWTELVDKVKDAMMRPVLTR